MSDYIDTEDIGINWNSVYIHRPTGLVVYDREAFESWLGSLRKRSDFAGFDVAEMMNGKGE